MAERQVETTKSIFRNVIYGFSTWFLPLGLSFVATPLIVKTLGEHEYGIYALILGFVGYSFNLSFGRAVTKYVAEYRAQSETGKIPNLIASALIINLTVGLSGVVVFCGSANWLVVDILKINAEDQSKALTAIYVAAGIIFFSMLAQIFGSVLQGIHRFDVYSNIFNVSNFILLSGNLILALCGFKLLSLFYWNLAVAVIFCAVYAVGAGRLMPEFGLIFKTRPSAFKLILKYSYGIIGYQILSNFLVLFERGWLTRKFGSESLTYYVVTMTLAVNIQGLIASLLLVIFPLASELKNQPEKLLRLYLKATKVVFILAVFMGMSLAVESRFFLTLWMGAAFGEQAWVILVVHAITFTIIAVQAVSWVLTEGLGYPNYNFRLFLICLVISLLLMIGLSSTLESVGVAVGRMLGHLLFLLSIFYVEKWIFGGILIRFWAKLGGVLLAAAVFSALIENFIIENSSVNWLTFVIATGSGAAVYILIVWFSGLVTADEKLLFKTLLIGKDKK